MSSSVRIFTTVGQVARRSLRPSAPVISKYRVVLPLQPNSILSQIPRRCFASEASDSDAPGASFSRTPTPPSSSGATNTPASPLPGDESSKPLGKLERPSYQLTFTCKPCGHRSSHVVTKQAYHHGTTLIKCPSCMDRHVISDHLKIFNEKAMSFEEILAMKGQKLQKAVRLEDDTIEFLEPDLLLMDGEPDVDAANAEPDAKAERKTDAPSTGSA